MSKHPTGRGSDQFVVRFPDGMRDEIRRAAEASGRSMNAEIIARLEASFADRAIDVPALDAAAETLDKLARNAEALRAALIWAGSKETPKPSDISERAWNELLSIWGVAKKNPK